MSVVGAPKKSSWQKQSAVVVSDSPNMHMLLRELLRSYGWSVGDSTPTTQEATEIVKAGRANLIILDDTPKAPSLLNARSLLADPVTICTPVLAFLQSAREGEEAAITKIGASGVVYKPLTPAKFVPGFVNLVRTWEKEPFLSLRRANYLYLSGDESRAAMVLAKMMQIPELQNLCAQAISIVLRRSGKLKEAERVLLTALKKSPRELGTIVALADLYMHAAMPKLAYKLLTGARTAFGTSLAMVPDLIQAAIMMGQFDDALKSLELILKRGEVDDLTMGFVGRLMFAEGREAEAEKLLLAHGLPFKKLQRSWLNADSQAQQPVQTAS